VRIPWQCKTLFAISAWGASFVATKAVLREAGPFTIVTTRFGMGVAVLLVTSAARGQMHRIQRSELATFALLGGVGVLLHQLLQITGLRYTSATNSGWIITLVPVFTVLLARLFLHERLAPPQIVGVLLAFCGALLVATRGRPSLEMLRLSSTLGDLLMLLSAPNWAVFSVLSKPVLRHRPAALVMHWVLLLGWVMTLPFFFASRGWEDYGRLSSTGWLALLFLGIFCSGVAFIFWYDSLEVADASQVSSFIYLEPLVTVAVAAWLLHEAITLPALAGGAILLTGVWLVNRSPRPLDPAT